MQLAALASLVHHGVIDSVKELFLFSGTFPCDDGSLASYTNDFAPLDLGLVPDDHLQALVPSVTEKAIITNVINCDMTRLLDSVQCKELRLTQRLNQEETEALVRAMT